MADVLIPKGIEDLLAQKQFKQAQDAATQYFESLTDPNKKVAFLDAYYRADPDYEKRIRTVAAAGGLPKESMGILNSVDALRAGRSPAPQPSPAYEMMPDEDRAALLDSFTKMRLSHKMKVIRSMSPESLGLFMEDMAEAHPEKLQAALEAKKLANDALNQFAGERPAAGFNGRSGGAVAPSGETSSATTASNQVKPTDTRGDEGKSKVFYDHNYGDDASEKTAEIEAIKELNKNKWLYPKKKTALIMEQVRNAANKIAELDFELKNDPSISDEDRSKRINKMIFKHMNAMEWLHTRTDYRLQFLLDLHQAGVKIPKALTEEDTKPNGNKFVPVIGRTGTDEIDSKPIINWAALKEAQDVIEHWERNPKLKKKRPDFFYGFKGDDEKLESDIYYTTNKIWHIEMRPAADKQARVNTLKGEKGLLAEFGNYGPGNKLALIQLCYSLRGKRFAGDLSAYYGGAEFNEANKTKTGSEANIAALMRAIFVKRGTQNQENDDDIFSFQEYDTKMHKHGHKLDKRLVSDRFWHGILGLGFREDGKYKPFIPTLLNPLNWSPRNIGNYIVNDLWGKRFSYHTHGASVDATGKLSWDKPGWEAESNIKWGFAHEWIAKTNTFNPAFHGYRLLNSFRIAAINSTVSEPKLADIWTPAAAQSSAQPAPGVDLQDSAPS